MNIVLPKLTLGRPLRRFAKLQVAFYPKDAHYSEQVGACLLAQVAAILDGRVAKDADCDPTAGLAIHHWSLELVRALYDMAPHKVDG